MMKQNLKSKGSKLSIIVKCLFILCTFFLFITVNSCDGLEDLFDDEMFDLDDNNIEGENCYKEGRRICHKYVIYGCSDGKWEEIQKCGKSAGCAESFDEAYCVDKY